VGLDICCVLSLLCSLLLPSHVFSRPGYHSPIIVRSQHPSSASIPCFYTSTVTRFTSATMASAELPKKYKAIVYDKPGSISTKIEELDMPEPGPGEVLINLYVYLPDSSYPHHVPCPYPVHGRITETAKNTLRRLPLRHGRNDKLMVHAPCPNPSRTSWRPRRRG
jgi:hypothetical protein